MTKKNVWLIALTAAVLLAVLIGFMALSTQKGGVHKGAKLVMCPARDAFMQMPEGVA